MPLSWNEIRYRAIAFSNEWAGVKSEQAEKQTFWNEFFEVFGVRRRVVASFEEPVRKISGQYGFIDLFWPGKVLVEHKSLGGNLGKAESQAFRYIQDLASEGRMDEIPRYVIVSDFARIALHDLEPDDQRVFPLFDTGRTVTVEFPLSELHKHIHLLAFMAGYTQHKFADHDPINIQAVGIMGKLHDALEAGGYSGHKLSASSFASSSASSPRTPESLSRNPLRTTSSTVPPPMAPTSASISRVSLKSWTRRPKSARRTSTKPSPPFPGSTARSSPKTCASPISTATCA